MLFIPMSLFPWVSLRMLNLKTIFKFWACVVPQQIQSIEKLCSQKTDFLKKGGSHCSFQSLEMS